MIHVISYDIEPLQYSGIEMHVVTCSCGQEWRDKDPHRAFADWAAHVATNGGTVEEIENTLDELENGVVIFTDRDCQWLAEIGILS